MNNNPYRAYWEKAQEQSLKLAQFYTPECLVELCIALLQPTGELFDPCCGLGSFLLKAKTQDETLKISGNDIAQDLGELPFEFTNSDYLNSEDKQFDYIIANIPFNLKKSHCDLVNENYCWIEKIIANTRKKALIILPSIANARANPKIAKKRKAIIESGVIELVLQLPSHLFNHTTISPCLWLINKDKKEKSLYFLSAEKFSEWEDEKKILTEENIEAICNQSNWTLASFQKIEEQNFIITPRRYEPLVENELSKEEIDQQLTQCVYELRHSLHLQITNACQKLLTLNKLGNLENKTLCDSKRMNKLEAEIQELFFKLHGDLFFKQKCDTEIVIKDYFNVIGGDTPSTRNPEYYEDGKIKFLNQGNLLDIYYLNDEITVGLITEKAVQENKMSFAKKYSVLMTGMAGIDQNILRRIIWCQSDNYTFNERIWNFTTKEENNAEYNQAALFFALRNQNKKIVSLLVGSRGTGGHINIKEISNLSIPWVSNPQIQEKLFNLLNKRLKVWGRLETETNQPLLPFNHSNNHPLNSEYHRNCCPTRKSNLKIYGK